MREEPGRGAAAAATGGGSGSAVEGVITLRSALGKPVVSKATAETLGSVRGAVFDAASRSVTAWQVGAGRKARLVSQADVSGLGDAALVVDDEACLREPATPDELATVKRRRRLLGSRVLNDAGDALGEVDDATVNTVTAVVTAVTVGPATFDGSSIRGFGTYALVLAAS